MTKGASKRQSSVSITETLTLRAVIVKIVLSNFEVVPRPRLLTLQETIKIAEKVSSDRSGAIMRRPSEGIVST